MLLAQAIQENHDMVWVALIGAAQAVLIAMFALLGGFLTYLVTRMNKQIAENTRITADTHRMVNGAFGEELAKTATALEGKAEASGKPKDVALAAVARKISDDKAANVLAGSPMVAPEVPPPGTH